MRSPELIKRLEALVCTGSPGLYRVITFFTVGHVYSLAELGHVASSMAIAQMAGYFTAIGWATLILVRLPAAANGHAAVDAFYALASMAAITTLAVTVGGIAVSLSNVFRFDVSAFLSLLWAWTAYQVARHYFVAHKRYRIAVMFDLALISGSCLSLWLCERWGVPSSFALAIALGAIAMAMFVAVGLPSAGVRLRAFDTKGLQFGLTNFLSGGVALVLVPAATLMCGASFAGTLSLLASVTAVGILLPRAISMAQLPELAKRRSAALSLDDTLRAMRRSIGWSNCAVLAINVALVVGVTIWQVRDRSEWATLIFVGIMLAVQCAVGMAGVVNSSVIMVFERSREAARINLQTSALFAALCGCSVLYGGTNGFVALLVASIVVAALRNAMTAYDIRAVVASYGLASRRGSDVATL